jgi:uncharacterized membrane protein
VVRAYLRKHRGAVPRVYKLAFAGGLAIAVAYIALQVALRWVDPVLANDLLRLLALTYIAGREPALFAVYHTDHPVPVAWAALMASLDDVATLLISVPAIWFMVDRLRRWPAVDAYLRSLERALHGHRRALDRWGVLAFAGFLWLPGWGTGPTVSGGVGVLAGLRPRRLLAALSVSAVGVNVFWAVALSGPAQAVPRGGWWDWIPLAVIAVLVCLAVLSAVRHHRNRHRLEYDRPAGMDARHASVLARRGFEEHGAVLVLDAHGLAARGGPPAHRLAWCHWAGELMLLPSVEPIWAGRLAALGITGLRDLALLPPELVSSTLGIHDAEDAALAVVWQREAEEALAASGNQAARGTAALASAP